MKSILEIVGGGVACVDFDLDGHCDLFFPGGGTLDPERRLIEGAASRLLRGTGSWSWTEVTSPTGTAITDMYSHGATAADFNHDGFIDLLVYGYQGVRLMRNQGDGTFQDVTTEVGLDQAPWTTAAAWGDLTGNGMLDLYLGSYVQWDFQTHVTCPTSDGRADVCSPNAFAPSEDQLFRCLADGSFESANDLVGTNLDGRALGVLVARLDGRPSPSIFVANDLSANFLLSPNGDGVYLETGVAAGVAVDDSGNANGSMGVALLDFYGNQRFDLIVTNFEHEQIALYRNDGDRLFQHASRDVALNTLDAAVVGFGVVAADWDGDGNEDVLLTSGHVQYFPDRGEVRQEPVLLRNVRGQFLQRQRPQCRYFHRKSCGRGLAVADLDNDGDPDVVVTHLFEPPVILESVAKPHQPWLRLELIGTESPRTPIGAIARISVGGKTMSRQLVGGGSYLSQSQPELFFRWPSGDSATVQIDWPSGRQTRFENVPARQRLLLVEP